MTLDEIVAEVLSHQFAAGQYTDYLMGTGSYGEGIVTQAQNYVTAQTDFRELFTAVTTTLSAGTEDLTLPTDFSRLYSLVCVGSTGQENIALQQITPSDFDALSNDSTGRPYFYDVNGDTLSVYPTPDASYDIQLRYWKVPDALSVGTDEPEIPSVYHHLLVSYSLVKCFERENDYDAAMYHQSRFDTELMKCRGEVQYDANDKTQPRVASGMWNPPETVLTVWSQ